MLTNSFAKSTDLAKKQWMDSSPSRFHLLIGRLDMQIQDDENVCILVSMGFYNVQDNKRALELSHNDISEAVCYLTGEYPGLIDLTVTEITCTTALNDNKDNGKMDVDNPESQHFPVAHFLDLESRVLSTSFHVPFTKFDSLEKCLNVAKRLAKDGLLESDPDCSRFVDVCFLKPCLDKLLTVQGVNRMNVDTLESIFHILQSFVDLVCFRMAFDPVPVSLFDCLSLVFDPQTIFNTKNYRKKLDKVCFERELGLDLVDYAINSSSDPQSEFFLEPCGYLIDLIDRFGVRGGFDMICKKFCVGAKISFTEMDQLLKPFAICVDFLNRPIVGHVFINCISFSLQKVEETIEADSIFQSENAESAITLLAYCKIIAMHLLKDENLGQKSEALQFKIIFFLMKSTNYGCRMLALKTSWDVESDRNREKLAALLCKIGQEADHYVYCFEKAAELLWMLAHQVGLPTSLLNACLELHLSIVGVSSRAHLAKEYVNKCFEDIQEGSFAYLATFHLLKMLQTIKTTSGSNKTHKAILENLVNKKSLIEALCSNLDRASEEVCEFFERMSKNGDDMIVDTPSATAIKDKTFDADIVLQSGYSYKQHVDQVLNFLRFALAEGNMYLSSSRCIELWNTLIVKSTGIDYAQDACFNFFLNGSDDIDDADTPEVFKKCIETLQPNQFTPIGFYCFEKYFKRANVVLKNLRNSSSADSTEVDDLNLIGLEKLRLISLNCTDSLVAEKAIQLLISIHYDWPSDRLRQKYRDQKSDLDLKFLGSLKNDLLGFLTQLKTGESIEIGIFRNIARILQIIRVFLLNARKTSAPYCPSHCAPSIVPHGASFCSKLISLDAEFDDQSKIRNEAEKANECIARLEFIADLNEMMGCLKERLVAAFQLDLGAVSFHVENEELEYSADYNILRNVFARFIPNETRNFDGGDGILRTDIKIVIKQRSKSIFTRLTPRKTSIGDNGFMSRPSSSCCISPRLNDYEKIVQALYQDKSALQLLFELADLGDAIVTDYCRLLLLDLPTDQRLLEKIDNLGYSTSAGIVPDVSASSKINFDHLSSVFECSKLFRMLYNLETLSSRLLPLHQSEWVSLRHGTLNFTKQLVGNHPLIEFLTLILKNDVASSINDLALRQSICGVVIQILRFLLCERSNLHLILENQRENVVKFYKTGIISINGATSHTSLLNPSPTPITPLNSAPTDQLFWLTLHIDDKSTKFLSSFNSQRLDELIEVLRYLTWSGAGTRLASNSRQVPLMNREIPNLMDAVSGRISESSAESTSDSEAAVSFLNVPMNLSSGNNYSILEIETACESFVFLIDLLNKRQDSIKSLFAMKFFRKFLLDCLLIVPNQHLRRTIRVHFLRLVKSSDLCLTLSASSLNEDNSNASTPGDSAMINGSSLDSSLIVVLFNVLQKSPVPLWGSTLKARSTARRLFAQCEEFFCLKNELLRSMTSDERSRIVPSLTQMLELEIDWISNFSCECSRTGLNSQESNRIICEVAPLLTGHLKNAKVLLELLPIKFKEECGAKLIKLLIEEFLFSSSQAVLRSKNGQGYDVRLIDANSAAGNSKCKTVGNRLAAYDLILELSKNCFKCYENVTKLLLTLNHQWSSDLNAEYEYAPLIDTKDANFGFVGLKNASATCYMNAILQQFFMEPGLIDSLLPIDLSSPLFKEIQRLFGHLKMSRQKFYEPRNFWNVFQFFGRPVNVREQQDAFEFYTCLVDQVDELLKNNEQQQIFKTRYQGAFSDQKICQGCPHRYEKDESFYSLNLPIKGHNLEEALNNFVKGELLEGDNAYLCELCNEKRTTVKRTCIKKCPPVVAIQLKRFYFDYNENRIIKSNDKFEIQCLSVCSLYKTYRFSSTTVSLCDSASTSLCPSAKKIHFTPVENVPKNDETAMFELVGVVVHSGQASAGHYYSFIKDRRPESVENGTKNKWFKFNDTTIEQVDMTPEFMEHELFGGTYKASTDKHSSFPEDRIRFWNAYMLFYSRVESSSKDFKSTRMTSKRSVSVSSPSGVSPRTKK
uniref:Ubiquitinyl hydrolase 1 n=1 Tax=Romanomermis culicivorax TaxID=13658 RepID=A0A915KXS8_ROMCU